MDWSDRQAIVSKKLSVMLGASALLVSPLCEAGKLLIAESGLKPERVAMFADDYAIERAASAMDIEAPTRTYVMHVTTVYESSDKPYWTEMELAFRCRNTLREALENKRPTRRTPAVDADVASVAEFSMLSGKTRHKNKVDHVPLSPAGWSSTPNPMMVQARNVACNMYRVKSALAASLKADKTIDYGRLSDAITGLGLQLVRPMPEDVVGYDFLAAASWSYVWPDATPPAIDRGRRLTEAESRQLDEQMAQIKSRIATAQGTAQEHAQQAIADREFADRALAFRSGRRLNSIERILLPAWEAATQDAIRQAFGDPARIEQGSASSVQLSYLGIFDNRNLAKTTRRLSSTVMFDEMMQTGHYEDCQVRFVMIPDNRGLMRVADVQVDAWHSQKGHSAASKDLCATALGVQ